MSNIHLDIPPIDKCVNIDSWGMICLGVGCNQCGRFSAKRNKNGRFIKIKKGGL